MDILVGYGDEVRDILNNDIIPSEEVLVALLAKAADEYENDGESEITDTEYDDLHLLLQTAYKNSSHLAKVGSDVRGGKIPLPMILGSMDQVYAGQAKVWIKNNSWEDEDFVLGNKEDGYSCLATYARNGQLEIAYSRGNGREGADVSRHVRKIKDFPMRMPIACAVRMEVIMNEKTFWDRMKSHPHEMLKSDGQPYKNPRNYVSGRMNASVSPDWFYANVRVIATSVLQPKMGKKKQYDFLTVNKWDVPHHILVRGQDINDEMLTKLLNEQRKASLTEIDGIVIDLDNAILRDALRRKSSSINPMYSKKFKVGKDDNIAFTKVIKVHYEASKDGYVKPRIEIEPVELSGVTVTYCTGFNAKFIRDGVRDLDGLILTWENNCIKYLIQHGHISINGNIEDKHLDKMLKSSIQRPILLKKSLTLIKKFALELPIKPVAKPIGPGAIIQMTRKGDVIPYCQKVIEPAATAQLPTEKEFGPLEWTEGDVDLKLIDPSNNREVRINILIDTFTKLDVPHLKQGSVEKLFDAGYKTAVSIIKANMVDLQRIIGESSGEKVFNGLKQKLNPVKLHILAGSSQMLGRGIGRRRVEMILAVFPDIKMWTKYGIVTKVEGFEELTASTVINNLPRFQQFLQDIDGYYTIAAPEEKVVGGSLDGKVFVFTGYRDKAAEKTIVERGGTVGTSVNKNTNYVVTDDRNGTSGKLTKAREFESTGLQIIEPNDLAKLLK